LRPLASVRTCLLAALIAVLALTVLAVAPAPPAESAPRWIEIKGPQRLQADRQLRYRIFCRDACMANVTTRLMWPGRPNLVTNIRGGFRAGETRANIMTLNDVALRVLEGNLATSRLYVVVRARNLERGITRTARRTFRFRR